MQDPTIPVIGFIAPSGSGKTTLLAQLIPILTERGSRVGYLKHAHHSFDIDVPGKDSYRMREAGAAQTLLASQERWALLCEATEKTADPDLGEMLARFDSDRLDLILVEGFKHAPYPKIEVYRNIGGEPPLYPDDPDVIAVVTNQALPVARPGADHPPVLPLDDPRAIADFVLDRVDDSYFCADK